MSLVPVELMSGEVLLSLRALKLPFLSQELCSWGTHWHSKEGSEGSSVVAFWDAKDPPDTVIWVWRREMGEVTFVFQGEAEGRNQSGQDCSGFPSPRQWHEQWRLRFPDLGPKARLATYLTATGSGDWASPLLLNPL